MLLTATRGDDVVLAIPVTVSLGTARALTFSAKRQIGDPDSAAVLTKDLDDGVAAASATLVEVTIDAADTDDLEAPAVFVWDLEAIDHDGKRATVAIGYLRLAADVTRDVAVPPGS